MEWIRENQILWKKIGIIAGVYLGIKYLVPLVIPFLIAALLVYWCWPFLCWTKRRFHIRPAVMMAVLILLAVTLIAVGFYIAGREAGGSLVDLFSQFSYRGELENFLYDCCDGVGELLHLESDGLKVFVTEQINVFRDQAQQKIFPGAFDGSLRVVKGAGSWIGGILVTVISLLLLSADFEKIKESGQKSPFYEKAAKTLRGILHSVGGYLKAQGIIMGIVMVICIAGIWISGSSDNPILAGIGTGFLDALPALGTGTVFLPWILLQVIQKEYTAAIILGVTYGICALAREFLEPKLVGNKLGILPVVILMSVYVGLKLYGLGGILLGPLSVLLIKELWRQVEES